MKYTDEKLLQKKEIGSRIQQLRNSQRMTKKEFASLLKMTESRYSGIENGIIELPDFLCRFVSIHFHSSIKWLMTGQGNMYLNNSTVHHSEPVETIREENSTNPEECRLELVKEISVLSKILRKLESCRNMSFDDQLLKITLAESIKKLDSNLHPEEWSLCRLDSSSAFLLPLLSVDDMAVLEKLLDNADRIPGGSSLSERVRGGSILLHTYQKKE